MKYTIAAAFILGVAAAIRIALYFGYRWIDRMLCVPPPLDPSKPIVRKR